MKTKDVIAMLQKEDPSGELECCVGNADIFTIEKMPGYWDGCLQVLVRDPSKKPYYDIVGGKFIGGCTKVNIRTLSIFDAVGNDPKFKVEYDSDSTKKKYEERIENERKGMDEIQEDIEKNMFVNYWKNRLSNMIENIGLEQDRVDILKIAVEFYDKCLSHKNKFPEDLPKTVKQKHGDREYDVYPSYYDKRHMQWDRELVFKEIEGGWKIEWAEHEEQNNI